MLTPEQKNAVHYVSSPLLLVAGPGSGKTRVIIEKIKFLLNSTPKNKEILALTFTQKAAEEMSQRLEDISLEQVQIGTFHSFALDLLEEFKEENKDFNSKYILIEDHHQLLFFMDFLQEYTPKELNYKDLSKMAFELQSFFSKIKDFGYSQREFQNIEFEDINIKIELFSVFIEYEKFKQKNNFIDFSDILLSCNKLLDNKKVIKILKERYSHILVDEFQDTNSIQFSLLKKILGNSCTIVGDQKQSIYGFRGSLKDAEKEFSKAFPNSKTMYLTKNFRSTKAIVDNCNLITTQIANENELMQSTQTEEGKITLTKTKDEFSQTSLVLEQIYDILEKDPSASIGILSRRKIELKEVSKQLDVTSINYDAPSIKVFLDNPFVKEAIFILDFLLQPKEANAELFFLLEQQTTLKKETLLFLSRKANLNERSLYNVLLKIDKKDFSETEFFELQNFIKIYKSCIELKSSKMNWKEYVLHFMHETKIFKRAIFKKENMVDLNIFISYIGSLEKTYKNSELTQLSKILQLSKKLNLSLEEDEDTKKKNSNIQLLTIHQSKGKEFDYVILPFLNQRKFPSSLKKFSFEDPFQISKEVHSEEEKRLFFVAISRAKKEAYLSFVEKYSENKLPAKKSSHLDLLPTLSSTSYSRIFENKKETSEIVYDEIVEFIQKDLANKQFSKAKENVELLDQLFTKKKSLLSFSKSEHPRFDYYQKKLLEKSQKEYVFDTSKMMYSVSQIKTYQSCPKKYEYQYIFKIPTSSKHYFDFGTSVHEVLETLKPLIDKGLSKEKSHLRALSLLTSSWISKSYINAKQEKEYFEKGVQAVYDFVEKEFEIRDGKRETTDLEKKFIIKIRGRRLIGFIDRIDKVDGEYEILDYKTSASMEPKNKLTNNLQLYVYAKAIKELFSTFPKKMGLWYLVHNKIDLVEFEEKILEEIEDEVEDEIKKIEKLDFSPKPSTFACTFCDFSNICSSSKK